MGKVSATDLAKEIFGLADILRGRLDVSGYAKVISGILAIKWASDHPGQLEVPERAAWTYVTEHADSAPGDVLNDAIHQLVLANGQTIGDALESVDFRKGLGRRELHALIDRVEKISLRADNLEFGDTVGSAYDDLLGQFALASGKKGGEFYTPRSVIQLMVRLVRPENGQSVYDPFAGSGGMLIQAQKYVAERTGPHAKLALFGQELNAETCSTARMNLLLHGITDASVLCGDTLDNPLHVLSDRTRMLFDRVLTNPPFSMNYRRDDMQFPERMSYGLAPKGGRKADLMNVQHVLASLKSDGIGAVVSPHGVLFRGGAEKEIRRGIISAGRLAAVIGIGPNVFHGTGIPACVLVLHGERRPPQDQSGNVLFISAEHEITTGRSQNYLEPRHIEKIVDTFIDRQDVVGFSRLVSLDEIAANNFNLNIRRYVKTGSPSQSESDPRALIQGGIPANLVLQHEVRFRNFGIDLLDWFEPLDDRYMKFPRDGSATALKRITQLASATGQIFHDRSSEWWVRAAEQLTGLTGTGSLLKSRGHFKESFCATLSGSRILSEHQLYGAFADWWEGNHDDLRRLDWSVLEKEDNSHTELEKVLHTLGNRLLSRLSGLVAAERQALIDLYRSWADQYATSLLDLEERRYAGARRLQSRLQQLGYPSPFTQHADSSDHQLP